MTAQKLMLITVIISTSLTLIMIIQTTFIYHGKVSNNLYLITISTGDICRNAALKMPEYSTNTELRNFNILRWFFNSCGNCRTSSREKAKDYQLNSANPNLTQNVSYCSDAASRRGHHQKILSFCFYENAEANKNYFEGIEENAKLIEKLYPNWTMRVYHNITPIERNASTTHKVFTLSQDLANSKSNRTKCDDLGITDKGLVNTTQGKIHYLECLYPNLDFCYVDAIPWFGNLSEHHPMTWRFLPMTDPLVDIFVSRDLDSRISEREVTAVKEWLASNLTFHVMRDHPQHEQEILGGMWGAVIYKERNKLAGITKEILKQGVRDYCYGKDQEILNDTLWQAAKGIVMQHDSYYCETFSSHGNMRPWPTERKNTSYNFVGARIGVDVEPMLCHCPSDCRPKDKQDRLTC